MAKLKGYYKFTDRLSSLGINYEVFMVEFKSNIRKFTNPDATKIDKNEAFNWIVDNGTVITKYLYNHLILKDYDSYISEDRSELARFRYLLFNVMADLVGCINLFDTIEEYRQHVISSLNTTYKSRSFMESIYGMLLSIYDTDLGIWNASIYQLYAVLEKYDDTKSGIISYLLSNVKFNIAKNVVRSALILAVKKYKLNMYYYHELKDYSYVDVRFNMVEDAIDNEIEAEGKLDGYNPQRYINYISVGVING